MQGARTNPLDLSNATPRRVPKLAVRNRSPDDVAVVDTSLSSEESHGEIQPAKDWPTSNVHRVPSKPILKNDPRHHRQDSNDSNASEPNARGRQPNKRKSSGVLGFLTLKEPSTSALDQFAEHERRKAAQKGAKSVAAVMPGVSSQKIPDYVPKVNSKWDGLPEGARRKSVDVRDKERMKRSSIISIGSASRGHSPRRLYGSMSSKPSARRSQEKKRTTVHVEEIEDDRPMSARAMYSPPPPNGTHPALRNATGQTFLDSPSGSPKQAYLATPDLELPELPPLQDRDYSSGTVTSPDASPRTPAFDSALPMGKMGPMPALSAQTNPAQDLAGTFYLSDSDDVIVKTAGPDVLQPPASFPTLRSIRSASKVNPAETIVEESDTPAGETKVRILSRTISGGADPGAGMVRNFSHVSKYYSRSNSHNSGPSEPSSTATTPPALQSPAFSLAPTESTRPTTMQSSSTADRGKSVSPMRLPSASPVAPVVSPPKDRMNLGAPIKKNEVLPWEMFEPPPEQPATPKKAAKGDSGKLKRLSYKLGKK